jgi:hypothetical protein
MVGTSPALAGVYNSASLVAKMRLAEPAPDELWTAQFAYSKSLGESHSGIYEMEMAWFWLVNTYVVTPDYRLHLNAEAMYFFDEKRPFSLRRPWPDRREAQFNVSAFNEIHLIRGWYVNAEAGLVGVAQKNPCVHLGVSFEHRWKRWLVHGGLSQTGTIWAYDHPGLRTDVQQTLLYTNTGFNQTLRSELTDNDYSIHPEFTAQVFF